MLLNVLAVGDVVGEGGQDILSRRLPGLREETGAHFCVVNGENASGVGITPAQARRVLEAGADVITLGNHTWNRIQIGAFLDKEDRILRPANYAGRVPGRGFGVYRCQGLALGVLNIMGRVDLNSNLDSPFKAANYFWNRGGFDLLLVDFHAEATSEKGAMGWHLDGGGLGDPYPRPHGGLPGAPPGHRLCHRPGNDGTRQLGAGHQAGKLPEPVPGRPAPAV